MQRTLNYVNDQAQIVDASLSSHTPMLHCLSKSLSTDGSSLASLTKPEEWAGIQPAAQLTLDMVRYARQVSTPGANEARDDSSLAGLIAEEEWVDILPETQRAIDSGMVGFSRESPTRKHATI